VTRYDIALGRQPPPAPLQVGWYEWAKYDPDKLLCVYDDRQPKTITVPTVNCLLNLPGPGNYTLEWN
jgi:hypothetical protein